MKFKPNEKLRQGSTHPRDQNSCPGTRLCGLGTVTLSGLSVSGEVLHGKQLITNCLLLQNDDNVPKQVSENSESWNYVPNRFSTVCSVVQKLFIQIIQILQIPHINLHRLHKYFIWVKQFFSSYIFYSRLDLLLIHHTPPIPNHFFRSHQPSTTLSISYDS